LIKEPTVLNYYHKDIEKSASLLSFATLEPKESENVVKLSQKLKDVLKVLYKIKKGEYIELRREKFAKHLSDSNEIMVANNMNRVKKEPKYALKILEAKDKYDKRLVDLALDKLVENEDFFTVKKYGKILVREIFKLFKERAKRSKVISGLVRRC